MNTTRGEVLVQGVVLDGRESKVLVSEYPFGASVLAYSSAEVSRNLELVGSVNWV